MKKFFMWSWLALLIAGAVLPAAVSAQDARIDSAFSDELVQRLGYPVVEVTITEEGVDAPAEIPAGLTLIRLVVEGDYVGYLNVVQPPEGLDDATAVEQMLMAGAGDLPQEGWTYFGGTNTPNVGETATFVIDLQPGDYSWGASYYPADTGGEGEVMRLEPFTVTSSATPMASPVASPVASAGPAADVTLTMTDDLQYIVTPDTITTGPHIWKIENTGTERSHHVVIFRVPDGSTQESIITEFSAVMMGTPPAGDGAMAQMVWSGYAAMQSGGTTTWAEFDFKPGTYAAICFIMDDEMSMPHMLDGMVTVFTVE